jgi:hypothetical protein
MPGMVGGFLRRDTNYLNINYKYYGIYNNIFACGNNLRVGLFSVLLSNEVMIEGLMNRRNSQINLKEKSKRSEDCVVYLSSTKVNFHFKIDSSTVVWVDYELRAKKGKGILKTEFPILPPCSISKQERTYIIPKCVF